MDKKKKHTTPEERIELWADLVREVSDKLPVGDKVKFINLCIEAYKSNGFDDEYDNAFFITDTYASPRWKKIINEAACGRDGVFIKYVRERDGNNFNGEWRKVNKREYLKEMQQEANGLSTRIENYNYNREVAQKRWKNLELPIFNVKQLPSNT